MSEISVIKTDTALTHERKYNPKQLELIRKTVASDTNGEEFDMFIEICRRQKLDPFRGQIYALVFNKGDANKRKVAFVTGIDGYRAIAKRTGNYRPDDGDPEVEIDESKKCKHTNPHGIVKVKVKVYQYQHGEWHAIVGTAHWDEFAPIYEEMEWIPVIDDNGNPVMQTSGQYKGRPLKEKVPKEGGRKYLQKEQWRTMPHVMIAKCAEAQALRRGWPEEMGNLYSQEEMHQAEVKEAVASEEIEAYKEEQRLRAVNAVDSIPLIIAETDGLEMIPTGQVFDKVLETLQAFESAQQIEFWRERNRIGLQQYWGRQPNDALELKKRIEQLVEEKAVIEHEPQEEGGLL